MGNDTSKLRGRESLKTALLPDLGNLTYTEIAAGTGISTSMLSRMFTDDPAQKRPNPTLNTLLVLQDYLERKTGRAVSMDALVAAIR